MYEKQVKLLRYCAEADCTECAVAGCPGPRKFLEEAADVIEKLTAEDTNVPRWTPVTEELPKTQKSILGKKSSTVIVAFRFNDGTQGTDTAHTLNGEWVFEDHITVVERTITHWMPLPDPPKEK